MIIDDLAGRKCATRFDISVRGTLGIVLVAKKRGIIHQARPIIEDNENWALFVEESLGQSLGTGG